MKLPIIAIDGPSGAGKGTVARTIATALGFRHVDSGAMYRAVGWKAVETHVSLDDEEAVARLRGSRADRCFDCAGHDRRRRCHKGDSHARDRPGGRSRGPIAESARRPGRASTADWHWWRSGDGRTRHRHGGLSTRRREDLSRRVAGGASSASRQRPGPFSSGPPAVSEVGTALAARDELDRTRTASPLYAAPDAVIVDTTEKSIEEVVKEVLAVIREKSEV